MTKTHKIIVLVLGVVALAAIAGGYMYPKFEASQVTAQASPAGSTFNTAKISSITGFAPATASATTTSLFNSDANDRIIRGSFVSCNTVGTSLTYLTGAGLSSLQFNFSTSSTATGFARTNTANAFITTVSTSTPNVYNASTTTPFPNDVSRIWPTQSYLVVSSNATNTASCIVGVDYLAS